MEPSTGETEIYNPRHRAAGTGILSTLTGWPRQAGNPLIVSMFASIVLVLGFATLALVPGGTGSVAVVTTGPDGGAPIVAGGVPSGNDSSAVPPSPGPPASASSAPARPPTPSPSRPRVQSPSPSASQTASQPALPSPSPSPSQSPPPPGNLSAAYRTVNAWNDGYTGKITLTATSTPFATWSVTVMLPAGSNMSPAWGAQVSTSGATVTLTPESWDASVSPGSRVVIGFQVNGDVHPPRPLSCSVDGQPCSGV